MCVKEQFEQILKIFQKVPTLHVLMGGCQVLESATSLLLTMFVGQTLFLHAET